MNFTELITVYDAYIGQEGDIDNAQIAIWFNEAQKDLAYDFGYAKDYTYEDGVPAGVGVALPADNIRFLDADQPYSFDSAGRIVFAYGGRPTITYRYMPTTRFTGGDSEETSELPAMVHDLMCLWAAYRYWLREAEGDSEEMNQAMRFYQDYQTAKAIAKVKLDNASNSKIDRWVIE